MAGEIKITGPDLRTEGLAIEALSTDIPSVGHVDGKPVIAVQTSDGPRVVGGRCTHYGGALGDGICFNEEIRCPLHHAAFDVRTGEAVGAPALDAIPAYETVVRDGQVFVTGEGKVVAPRRRPPYFPYSVVIVGAGAAGAVAAETLRRYGYTLPIVLIGEEPPVDRPNVSKDYLAGTAPEEWMPLRPPEFYAEADIELITGETVTSIDVLERIVRTSGNRELTYGALLMAPGAEPLRLSVPGADLPHVHHLRTLNDAREIIADLDTAKKVVVVGAGFIGLEAAASLRQRDLDVTVVTSAEVPLARLIGQTLGQFVADLHGEHGVVFRLGTRVSRIGEREVALDDGTSVAADLVVVGMGVTPNTRLAESMGLTLDNGIVVDDRLRTSEPYIWAAGDVASYPGPDGILVRAEHWVPAEHQGQTAARNMLGHDIAFTEPPFFWSEQYGVRINVTGHLAGWDEEIVAGDPHQSDMLVGFRKGGVISAVASIGRDRDNLRAEHALAVGDQQALEDLLR